MQHLTTTAMALTMTSREIAQLTGKQHQHVRRDIAAMLSDLGEDASSFGRIYFDTHGREQEEYHLDRELTETLLTGYSAVARRKVIQRWHDLEGKNFDAALTVPSAIEAKLREQLGIAALFQIPVHMAQVEAVKVVKNETGADLSPWLKLAPAQSNLKADDLFLEPNDLATRLSIGSGAKLNRMLVDAGLQCGSPGYWKPTALAQGHALSHQWTNGSKSGVNLKWRASFVQQALASVEA